MVIHSWLGLSHAISFDVGSFVSGCGNSWGRAGVKGGCVGESDEVSMESMIGCLGSADSFPL